MGTVTCAERHNYNFNSSSTDIDKVSPSMEVACVWQGTGPKADLCSPGGNEREQNNDVVSSTRSE